MLPPVLADSNHFDTWMNSFFTTLRRPSLHPFVSDPDDLLYEPESKTKKWLSQIAAKFLKRYGSPKRIPLDEPWSKKVAQNFRDNHAEKATEVMLEVLFSPTSGYQISRRVAHIALDFLEEAIETASLWAIVSPHVSNLLTRVIFPYLCFTDADEEVWVSDPTEYVRKQYDFTDDFSSPRMAASNLLSKMADLRSKKTVFPFLEHLHETVLNPYLVSAPHSAPRAAYARQKVGTFAALAAVKAKLISKPELSNTFLMIIRKHVQPDLHSEFGFLRAEAVWLVGQVASCEWKEFITEQGDSCLRSCVALLSDSELPVQAAAGGALQYLMDQDSPIPLIRAVAPELMQRLLALMYNMNGSYQSLIPSLEKLIIRYPDEIMPLCLPILQRLMASFRQAAQSILSDGEEDDDDVAFTAAQVLHLISTVLSSVGEWSKPPLADKKELLLSIEKELQPLLVPMFQENHQVFVEELLDVLGTLIVQLGEHNDELTPFLRSMICRMFNAFHGWAGDYIEQMMDAIEGYLLFDMQAIAQMNNGVSMFVDIVVTLWSPIFDAGDAVFGSMIAEYLLLKLNLVKPRQFELLKSAAVMLARGAAQRTLRIKDDDINLRQRLFAVVMLCLYVDPENVMKSLGVQSVLQLIGSHTGKLQLFERIHAKKSIILGLGAMLSTTGLLNEEQKVQLLHLAVCLQQMIDSQRASAVKKASIAGNNFATVPRQANGLGYPNFIDDNGSDLEENEDATNVMDDPQNFNSDMERLVAETGFSVSQLEELGAANGVIDIGLFDIDDSHDLDDEGGYRTNPIDDIDEALYLVNKVKESSIGSWWSRVSDEDRRWLQQLADQECS